MKICPINFITNSLNTNFKAKKIYYTVPTDSFSKQGAQYSQKQQIEIIAGFDEEIEALKQELETLKRSPQKTISQINGIKAKIKEVMSKKEAALASFNSNVSILYENIAPGIIARYLKRHPEIQSLDTLDRENDKTYNELWRNKDFFILNRTPVGIYLDTSYVPNIANYQRMNKNSVMSFDAFQKKYEISAYEFIKYRENKILAPLSLRQLTTGKNIPTELIDVEDDKGINRSALERHFKLQNLVKPSPYIDREDIPAEYLAALGFGSEEEIVKAIQSGKLEGKISFEETEKGFKRVALVPFNKVETKAKLRTLKAKNKNVLDTYKLIRMTGMDRFNIETAVLDGKLKVIEHYIYPEDKNEMLFDLKNPVNAEFISRRRLEHTLFEGGCSKKDSNTVRILWYLCPKVKQRGQVLLVKDSEPIKLFQKSKKTPLNYEETQKMKAFSESLWQEEEDEEFKQALADIQTAQSEYRAGGVDNIKNDKIRKLILHFVSKRPVKHF